MLPTDHCLINIRRESKHKEKWDYAKHLENKRVNHGDASGREKKQNDQSWDDEKVEEAVGEECHFHVAGMVRYCLMSGHCLLFNLPLTVTHFMCWKQTYDKVKSCHDLSVEWLLSYLPNPIKRQNNTSAVSKSISPASGLVRL